MDASINPAMITLARESRGLTQTDLSAMLRISQALLSRIEAGVAVPTPEIVDAIGHTLDYPPAFFVQTDPVFGPGISEFFHRRRQDVPAKTIGRIHAIINVCRMHVARLLRSVDIPEVKIQPIELSEFNNRPEDIARVVRASWQLPVGPIANVIKIIEDNGGIVIRYPFGTPKMDAISRWVPGLPPLFFVNEGLPTDRERLTLCHELGHLILHNVPTSDMENEANRFAAEFLMPEREVRPHLAHLNLERLAAIKPYWRVSMAAALHRASDLKMISERYYRTLWMRMSQLGYKRREPPELDLSPESPRLLQEIVNVYRDHFGYDISEFRDLLNGNESDLIAIYKLKQNQPEVKARLRIVR
jgi:Zn-dependent peptidase ImmA (M78 family)